MRAFALTATAVLIGVSWLRAADWPMLGRDFTRNAVSPEKDSPTDFRFDVKDDNGAYTTRAKGITWAADLGTRTVSPPVISDGLVWIGTNARPPDDEKIPSKAWDGGILLCLRESDGKLLWRNRTPRLKTAWPNDFPMSALGSVPLVEGNRLWFTNNRAEVVCLDIARLKTGDGTPAEVWKYDMRKELDVFTHLPLMQGGAAASVAGFRDRLFVVTHNGVDESHINIPSPKAPSLICLDKATGKLLWKDASPGKDILHVQISSPLVCEVGGRAQVIVGQGDGWLRSFDAATGKLLWKCDLNPKDTTYELGGTGDKNYVVAAPVLYDGRVYIPTGQEVEHAAGPAALYCIDPTKDGDVSRELDAGPKKGKPNPNSAVVWYTPRVVPDDAARVVIERKKKDGTIRRFDLLRDSRDFYFGRTIASVTAHDGLVFAGEIGGFFYCFDARTGKLYWYDNLKSTIWSQPLWADGKVFVTTDAGDVVIYAHGKEKKELARMECDNSIHAGAVYANRTLYIPADNKLYAIRSPK